MNFEIILRLLKKIDLICDILKKSKNKEKRKKPEKNYIYY